MTVQGSAAVPEGTTRGHAAELADLFQRYHQRLCRYLVSMVADADLAEDLAQQTFVQAHRALQRGVVPENPQAWLYRIATNAAFSAIRRRRLRSMLPFGADGHAGSRDDHATSLSQRDLLERALACLAKPDAASLLLRFQHELSYEELAEVLGTSADAAKMRICRARVALREAYLRLSQEAMR